MTLKAGGLIGAFVAWPSLSGLDLKGPLPSYSSLLYSTCGVMSVALYRIRIQAFPPCSISVLPRPYYSCAYGALYHSRRGDEILEMWGSCQMTLGLAGMR